MSVPLFVGVTGHRMIHSEDEAAAKAAFGEVLERFEREYPNSAPAVLTALAVGADLLAAEEALARGIAVIACIPVSVETYEGDFGPVELERFRAALRACARVHVVPAHDLAAGYGAVGMHIARTCHVLVAFWDGQASRGPGGTADVVRARLTGIAPATGDLGDIPDVPDIGPVAHILTPRAGEPRTHDAFATSWLHPRRFHHDVSAERDFWLALDLFDRYNEDLAAHPGSGSNSPLASLADATDRAANVLQRRTFAFLLALYGFAFVAAFTQIVLGSEWLKLATLGLAFLAYLLVRRRDLENRYQDYRAVSEALRVQVAWDDVGLIESVESHYLRTQQGELQWIRMALRAARAWYRTPFEPDERRAVEWVRGQWRYFYRAARRQARYARACGLAAKVAAIGAIVVGATTLVVLPEVRWFAVALALGATSAALIGSYAEKRGFGINSRRYERMFVVFDRARRRLQAVARGGPGRVPAIVGEIGREALVEQADWLLIRRDRPVSFVQS